jgi:hypothetical protein
MLEMRKMYDPWMLIVIVVTFILFAVALFTKGFTHDLLLEDDLLLEAGVFLVSLKLILMSHRNSKRTDLFFKELRKIEGQLQGLDDRLR